MKALFVTWDGPGPNYHESLFLPLYGRLQSCMAVRFHLLQYTWGADDRSASVARAARALDMPYTVRSVWRHPPAAATAAMMVRGALDIVNYVRKHRVDVLMPRSIIPAGMALLACRMLPTVRLLYDADGLMADERADFGGWSRNGKPYRFLRAIEKAAVRRADAVITRTRRARAILIDRAGQASAATRVMVVANGRDAQHFRPGTEGDRAGVRASLGVAADAPLVVYAGSLGPQYHVDRMFSFFSIVHRQRCDTRFLLLSGTPEVANRYIHEAQCAAGAVIVKRVSAEEIPRYLAAADLGLAFRAPRLSQQAVSPIKVGEYLLCGVAVLSTGGIGDLDDQLDGSVGLLLNTLDQGSLEQAAGWFLTDVVRGRSAYRERCRARGMELFDLTGCVDQYRRAMEAVADSVSACAF